MSEDSVPGVWQDDECVIALDKILYMYWSDSEAVKVVKKDQAKTLAIVFGTSLKFRFPANEQADSLIRAFNLYHETRGSGRSA